VAQLSQKCQQLVISCVIRNFLFDPKNVRDSPIRWLGDRKGIERRTKTWDKPIRDCRKPLQEWVKICDQAVRRGVSVYAYANNHYAGHGPTAVRLFQELGRKEGATMKA
jgi:uncharacterized protein YecE (DUF72 family)